MSTEILTALIVGAALLIPIVLVLGMAMERTKHCGEDFRSCFFCSKDCTLYNLDKVEVGDAEEEENKVVEA